MKKTVVLIGLSFGLLSCNQAVKENETASYQDKDSNSIAQNMTKSEANSILDGYGLMKENCYACHNPNTKSHDDILAPPFAAVKRRYSMQYSNKEEFVTAVINWTQNPNEDEALMRGAVNKFKVMPKLPLENNEIQAIASYMYDNDIEQPAWFEEHEKEMHGNGNGTRQGKGMGNGKGKGKRKGNGNGNGNGMNRNIN